MTLNPLTATAGLSLANTVFTIPFIGLRNSSLVGITSLAVFTSQYLIQPIFYQCTESTQAQLKSINVAPAMKKVALLGTTIFSLYLCYQTSLSVPIVLKTIEHIYQYRSLLPLAFNNNYLAIPKVVSLLTLIPTTTNLIEESIDAIEEMLSCSINETAKNTCLNIAVLSLGSVFLIAPITQQPASVVCLASAVSGLCLSLISKNDE